MKTDYDYIVLGCGGIGSAALYWLAAAWAATYWALNSLNFFIPMARSQDYSRIIRYYYHKDCYARLTPHTYAAWADMAEQSGSSR